MKILCILTNDFEDIEAIGTIALLRRAGLTVDVFSMHGESAKGKYGTEIVNINHLRYLNLSDYVGLFIPGGPEYKELQTSEYFLDVVRYFHDHNLYIAAICAAPTILGHLGYLKGLRYTCFTAMNEDFGGTFVDSYAVQDRKIITGQSAAAVIDFAFLIVKTLLGETREKEVKEHIYYKK